MVIVEKERGIFMYYNGGDCTIEVTVNDGDKGRFIIYDFKALYEIKLNNKYGITMNEKFDWITVVDEGFYNESMSKLTFLVPNFTTNSNITFQYIENGEGFSPFVNPFKVCHENICKENIKSYYFEKGKSYQIYIKVQKVLAYGEEYRYAVPPFRFYANEEYSNDDIKYTYNETKPDPPPPPSSSKYRQASKGILALLTLLLF